MVLDNIWCKDPIQLKLFASPRFYLEQGREHDNNKNSTHLPSNVAVDALVTIAESALVS